MRLDNPRRILIIDDDSDWTESLSDLLQHWGHEVRVLNVGVDALERVRAFAPSLVILDVDLPDVSGYDVARTLRTVPELGDIKIIALTGHERPPGRDREGKPDLDGHWVKPLDPGALKRLLVAL